ncbi:hypothetical protein G7054_g8890 [Neopestalotiopsis clavispora]|nr:hypothetical protein G7054_g8890 [Neopestalotiopsis clavispora]
MALVDYDSDSESSAASDRGREEEDTAGRDSGPAPKRQKKSFDEEDHDPSSVPSSSPKKQQQQQQKKKKKTEGNVDLPPLPSAFHDLYASTVRRSNTDDPSLHQGRRRQVPHIAGNWPSHLYVEWHLTGAEHELLSSLLSTLSSRLEDKNNSCTRAEEAVVTIHDFLTSDLGAPLPLHISLSRPLSLTTARKDEFLDRVRDVVSKSGVQAFDLAPDGLEWHRTHESARSFLVLRVRSRTSIIAPSSSNLPGRSFTKAKSEMKQQKNQELGALLRHCNSLCQSFGQPELYAFKHTEDGGTARDVGDAFHVSVAWSFSEPTDELKRVTQEVYRMIQYRRAVEEISIRVDGMKAKIGNTITHLPLAASGNGDSIGLRKRRALFYTE